MLNVINKQKNERDVFLSNNYIQRDGVNDAKKVLDSKLIKVIVGPRRAGKSVFGFLMLEGKNFAYLNFDDENLLKSKDYDDLLLWLKKVYLGFNYIFLDEIQNLPQWELWVNKLQRRGYNLILTGSNSKLLSGELASSLTGRYHQIEVLPLSFEEIRKIDPNYQLVDYLFSGGYPEVIINKLEVNSYLKTLFEAILFKDVVKRFNLRHPQKIYNLGLYLMSNFATTYSYGKLKEHLSLSSVSTTQKYVNLLEQTFLFFSLNRFDFKLKKQFNYNKKMYIVDNGFGGSIGVQNSENLGRLLENVVFINFVRQGLVPNKDIFYYKTKSGKEVDFLIKNGVKVEKLVQVALSLDDPKTKKREINSLLEASYELNCYNLEIITLDENMNEGQIKIISY